MQTPHVSDQPSDDRRATSDIAVVEQFFAAMVANDLERGLEILTEDTVYQNVPFPADHGKKAVRRTFELFGKFVTSFQVEMRNIAARGGVVLTERVDILSGPLVYLDLPVCGTFELRGGKIALWRDYFDLAAATAKLFASPFRKLYQTTMRSRSGAH
jgi:limonene-1,2-epoxide hydrolase